MKSFMRAGASALALAAIAAPAFADPGARTTFSPAVTQGTAADAASIDQIGANNRATVNQPDSTATGDNAVVIQGGFGYGSAQGASATVTQQGSGQLALVMQGTTDGTGFEHGPTGDAGNTATIDQSGKNSNALAYQFGAGNSATIQTYEQSALRGRVPYDGVNGRRDAGRGVQAAVMIRATPTAVIQNAVTDTAAGTIVPVASSEVVQDWSVNNAAAIYAQGQNDRSQVVQGFQSQSTGKVRQEGDFLYGSVSQEGVTAAGTNDIADLSQVGSFDGAAIVQLDATNSYGSISQSGTSSSAFLYQTGDQNYATLVQHGASNQLTVAQSGGNDAADVTQFGLLNSASVTQGLANGWAHVYQSGFSNTATINQYSGATPPPMLNGH